MLLRLVCSTRPHTQRVERVVGIGFQPGLDPAKVECRVVANKLNTDIFEIIC